jgi:6-pyruvoyltetrahydropterin/6-carboxytetrahydropterin synthase
MNKIKLGVEQTFEAAHSLPGYNGKCKNVHGHTYTVEVVVEGNLDTKTNFVMDYFELRRIVNDVLEEIDHTFLNDIIEYPSCENILLFIKKKLERKLKNKKVSLVSVKLWEGKGQWAMVESP